MANHLHQPPRRWFQFRLRTLLIAVAVLAVPCAWVGYSLSWIRQRHEFLAMENVGSMQTDGVPISGGHPIAAPPEFKRAPGCLWLLRERGCFGVIVPRPLMPEAKRLFPEARIWELDLEMDDET